MQRKPRTLDKLDFLWQYFVKTEQPLRAATVLANIAGSLESVVFSFLTVCTDNQLHRFPLTLDKRIEYLTLASNNAKSHSGLEQRQHENAVEFLTDIDEKLEVAQVQRELLHALHGKFQGENLESLQHLESELLNITQVRLWRFCCLQFH